VIDKLTTDGHATDGEFGDLEDLYGALVLNFANVEDFFRDHFPSDRFLKGEIEIKL